MDILFIVLDSLVFFCLIVCDVVRRFALAVGHFLNDRRYRDTKTGRNGHKHTESYHKVKFFLVIVVNVLACTCGGLHLVLVNFFL